MLGAVVLTSSGAGLYKGVEEIQTRMRQQTPHELISHADGKRAPRTRPSLEEWSKALAAAEQAARSVDELEPMARLLRTIALVLTGSCMWFLGRVVNTTDIDGEDRLHLYVDRRPPGRGLLTVSNHISTLDDPIMMAALVPLRTYLQPSHFDARLRWALCAHEICYRTAALRSFFTQMQALPVDRGAGLSQFAVHASAQKLRDGGWVHVFPEGAVHRASDGTTRSMKWGVAQMLLESSIGRTGAVEPRAPLLVPLYHRGMENVMPNTVGVPGVGQKISVSVGAPIDVDDIVLQLQQGALPWPQARVAVMERIELSIAELKVRHNVRFQLSATVAHATHVKEHDGYLSHASALQRTQRHEPR